MVLCVKISVVVQQASNVIVSALNQNLVEFELKPGVRVIVYNTQLTLGEELFVSLLLKPTLSCQRSSLAKNNGC